MGLLRPRPALRSRPECLAHPVKPSLWRRQPFLECLETRTVPSILSASSSLLNPPVNTVVGGSSSRELGDPPNQQHGQNGSPSDGGQDGPSGKKNAAVDPAADLQLGVQSVFVGTLSPANGGQGNSQEGPGNNGQNGAPGDTPADAGGSDGPATQDGGNIGGQVDNTGDHAPADPTTAQGDNSDGGQSSGQAAVQGVSSDGETAGTDSSTHTCGKTQDGPCDSTKNSRSDSQGGEQKAPLEASQGAKTSDPPAVTGTAASDEMSTSTTGQSSAADRKQHNSSSGSISEGEQHGPANIQDGRQRSPDSSLLSSEELYSFASQTGSETEQNNRNQAVAPSQQQNVAWEELGQRKVDERVPHGEARQRFATEEETPPPEVVTSAAFQLTELANAGYPYAAPDSHEPLTDGLSFDLASLRAEVHHFFERLNDLGGHPTEKQISVLLSSGAVVVAAAMACEVARRQARRATPGSPFALVPKLELAKESDGMSSAGLPNFGQFSAFR
jgi:hypothetical protein